MSGASWYLRSAPCLKNSGIEEGLFHGCCNGRVAESTSDFLLD